MHEVLVAALWLVIAACIVVGVATACKIYQQNLPDYVPRHSARLQQQVRQPLAIEAARQQDGNQVTRLPEWLNG